MRRNNLPNPMLHEIRSANTRPTRTALPHKSQPYAKTIERMAGVGYNRNREVSALLNAQTKGRQIGGRVNPETDYSRFGDLPNKQMAIQQNKFLKPTNDQAKEMLRSGNANRRVIAKSRYVNGIAGKGFEGENLVIPKRGRPYKGQPNSLPLMTKRQSSKIRKNEEKDNSWLNRFLNFITMLSLPVTASFGDELASAGLGKIAGKSATSAINLTPLSPVDLAMAGWTSADIINAIQNEVYYNTLFGQPNAVNKVSPNEYEQPTVLTNNIRYVNQTRNPYGIKNNPYYMDPMEKDKRIANINAFIEGNESAPLISRVGPYANYQMNRMADFFGNAQAMQFGNIGSMKAPTTPEEIAQRDAYLKDMDYYYRLRQYPDVVPSALTPLMPDAYKKTNWNEQKRDYFSGTDNTESRPEENELPSVVDKLIYGQTNPMTENLRLNWSQTPNLWDLPTREIQEYARFGKPTQRRNKPTWDLALQEAMGSFLTQNFVMPQGTAAEGLEKLRLLFGMYGLNNAMAQGISSQVSGYDKGGFKRDELVYNNPINSDKWNFNFDKDFYAFPLDPKNVKYISQNFNPFGENEKSYELFEDLNFLQNNPYMVGVQQSNIPENQFATVVSDKGIKEKLKEKFNDSFRKPYFTNASLGKSLNNKYNSKNDIIKKSMGSIVKNKYFNEKGKNK